MVVKQSIPDADDGLAVSGWIPGNTDPRSNVVVIARDAFHDTKRLFGSRIDVGGGLE